MKLIIIIFLYTFSQFVFACSCEWVCEELENAQLAEQGKPHKTPEELFENRLYSNVEINKVVYRGFVYQGHVVEGISKMDAINYKVKVVKIYKGKISEELVLSSEQLTSCNGPVLEVGAEYIFFGATKYLSQCELLIHGHYDIIEAEKKIEKITTKQSAS